MNRNSRYDSAGTPELIRRALDEQGSPLFLHCFKGGGFLPAYYGGLGFKALSETELDNGPWVLMKHPLP